MITLFGATGYTGERVARTLSRLGLPFRLAGRSEEKLAALSRRLPGTPSWVTADARRPESLPALMGNGTRMLINCAGPFTDLGERVVALAALNGVHYLDVTNELGYRYRLRSYHELAREKGAAIVPACGFEVALSDCAAALVGARLSGAADDLDVVYILRGTGASAGTLQSGVRSLGTSWIAYRQGAWRGSTPGGRVRGFQLPGEGAIQAVEFPSCESVTVPASISVSNVSVWMSLHPSARLWAPLLLPLGARLASSRWIGPWLVKLAGRRGKRADGGEATVEPGENTFTIWVRAAQGPAAAWMMLRGSDVYGLTAEIAGYAARVMLADGYNQRGVLAPAQALPPGAFIGWLQDEQGVRVQEGNGTN